VVKLVSLTIVFPAISAREKMNDDARNKDKLTCVFDYRYLIVERAQKIKLSIKKSHLS